MVNDVTKPRIATRLTGAFEYLYDIETVGSAIDLDAPILPYHSLTTRQQCEHQFHNEVAIMVALQGTGLVPKILDVDREKLSFTVEDMGQPTRRFDHTGMGR